MRRSAGVLAAGLALGALALPATSEEIGNALQVHRDVRGYLVGEQSQEIRQYDPIERGLRVHLSGPNPYLMVALNLGGICALNRPGSHQFVGTARLKGPSEMVFGDSINSLATELVLTLGRLWLAHHFDAQNHDAQNVAADCKLEVNTPHAVIQPLGTYLRVLVDPAVGTFVAVDEGTVTVQAKAGGSPVEVKAGSWVLVPPGGLPTRPAPLPPGDDDKILQDPPLLGCCTGVEPPKPPGH
jgi:hypothetical protein